MQNPSNICPQCQSPIPADAPGGLCPACVLLGVAGRTNLNQGDGIHPNSAGERIVADNIWRGLVPVLTEVGR